MSGKPDNPKSPSPGQSPPPALKPRVALSIDRVLPIAENAIREAIKSGEFDELEGKGRPLPGIDGQYDELWWIRSMMQREQISAIPKSLEVRRRVEQKMDQIMRSGSETEVRNEIATLNEEIKRANATSMNGPATSIAPFDVESVVSRWRQAQSARDF